MDNHKIWAPIEKVEQGRYLYYYTTYNNAVKILYYDTLKFSKLNSSNDAFEQKPKVKFDSKDLALQKMFTQIHDGFEKIRGNIRILCFSTDAVFEKIQKQYQEMNLLLSKDLIRENVMGRGFALPRMWAQYANRNQGVCFVFDKKKLEDRLKRSRIVFNSRHVDYVTYYKPFEITEKQLNYIQKGINIDPSYFVNQITTSDSKYINYNYFTKLEDWSSENEYRYITFNNSIVDEDVEISSISSALCGVVIGERMCDVEKYMISLLLEDSFDGLPLKQIVFEDLTTRIKAVASSSRKKGSTDNV